MLTDVPSAAEWDMNREAATARVLETHWAASSAPSDGTTHVPAHSFPRFGPQDEIQEFARISDLSTDVRRIWRANALQEKGHRVLLLHEVIARTGNPTFLLSAAIGQSIGRLGPFAQSILYLLTNADRALVCKNPECPAALFFRSRSKRRQAYCSPKCSGYGQKKAKLDWWREHGEARRKQLGQEQPKTKQTKKGNKHGTGKAR